MTISEAKKEWVISDRRMTALLESGLLRDVKIDNGKVILPDHKKILLPKNNQKINQEYVVKSILVMCNSLGYVDNKLLGISESVFERIIITMEKDELLHKSSNNYPMYTNLNYTITDKGIERIKKKNFKLSEIIKGLSDVVFILSLFIQR